MVFITFFRNQLKILYDTLRNLTNLNFIFIFALFVFLNIVKISLYNFFIVSNQTEIMFQYKFYYTSLLLMLFNILLFQKKSKFLFIIGYIVQSLYIFINMEYHAYFHSYLSITQCFSLFHEATALVSNFAIPWSNNLLIVFIDLPVFIAFITYYKKIHEVKKRLQFFSTVIVVILCCFLFSQELSNYRHQIFISQVKNITYSGESFIIERYGTLVNSLIGISNYKSEPELINSLRYGQTITASSISKDNPNFFLIQVESLDANIIDQKYKNTYVAPFLKSLTSKSVYFPYTLSYHRGGGTSDCEFSVINSIEPLDKTPAIKLKQYNFPNSMLKQFDLASYKSLAFHGNVGSYYDRDWAFAKMGYSKFFDRASMKFTENGWGIPDHNVFSFALQTTKGLKQPFLSHIITLSSHEPFNYTDTYSNFPLYNDIPDTIVKNYYHSISYVDATIKDAVSKIQAEFTNTYIFIYGDHTPGLNSSTYKQSGTMLGENYLEFVPLFIITPDNKKHYEKSKVASFLDISPTILNASHIPHSMKSDGEDLLSNSSLKNKIPIKGVYFDRTTLFNKISQGRNSK